MRRSAFAVVALALASLLGACAGLQQLVGSGLQKPKLTFRSASVESLDMEGATLAFTWDLENPNGFGVDLARLAWTVEAEGTRVASGIVESGLTIAAKATAPFTLPVRVRYQDVPGIVALLGSGKDVISYRLAATLGVRTPVGVLDLPLSHDDRLRLPSLPRFGVEGIALRRASFSEVALDVRIRVQNPNAFALPLGRLEYALALDGAPVARADGAELAAVAGGASAVVAIPVRLDVASAGRVAVELARGADVQVDLTGRAVLAGLPLPLDVRARVPARR